MPTEPRLVPGQGPDAEPLNLATDSLPQVVVRLLKVLGLDQPLGIEGGSSLASSPTGTKPLTEMLGEIFTPKTSTGSMPKRIRVSSLDPAENLARTFGGKATGPLDIPMDSSMDDLARLIKSGELIPEGPAEKTIPQLLAQLKRVLKAR